MANKPHWMRAPRAAALVQQGAAVASLIGLGACLGGSEKISEDTGYMPPGDPGGTYPYVGTSPGTTDTSPDDTGTTDTSPVDTSPTDTSPTDTSTDTAADDTAAEDTGAPPAPAAVGPLPTPSGSLTK